MARTRYLGVLVALWLVALGAELPPVTQTIEVPMRDGTKLATDLYLPSPEARHLPCILVRSPSGRRQPYFAPICQLAQAGYVVAIQDTRSATDPLGATMPFLADGWGEQQDGYDAIEWLADSHWTNGRIGTMGASAMGITQFLVAPTQPKGLKCQHIGTAAAVPYHHIAYGGGRLNKNTVEGWLREHADHPSVLQKILDENEDGPFWEQLNCALVGDRVTTPAVQWTGWYDLFLQGTIDGFKVRQEKGEVAACGRQRLVIGPWGHFWPMDNSLGDFEVPEAARNMPLGLGALEWFDHYLKNDACSDPHPAVTYYVMGPFDEKETVGHLWKTAEHWPVPSTPTELFLSSEGTLAACPTGAQTLCLEHHPDSPIPTVGGRNLFLASGPKDQRCIEERDDVHVFTSAVLEQDVEVTGQLGATLYVEGTGRDVDVAVRLTDVYPDGRSILLADGLSRVGTEVGVKRVDVDLMATSVLIPKGHRMRVLVCTSNYPRYDVPKEAATAQLHFGAEACASKIVLPVVSGSLPGRPA